MRFFSSSFYQDDQFIVSHLENFFRTTFLHVSLVYHRHDRKEYANISQAFILKDVADESINHASIFRSEIEVHLPIGVALYNRVSIR